MNDENNAILETPITVLGAGSWGTSLAILLARNGQPVNLWGHDPHQVRQMQQTRLNARYLPGVIFPPTLTLCHDLPAALYNTQDILIALPSHAFVDILTQIKPHLLPEARLVWGTKGLTTEKELLHVAAIRILGQQRDLAVLSGPSFAAELAKKSPTAITLAANNSAFSAALIARFSNDYFRIYTSDDMTGVETAGVIKNVLAIAAGMIAGSGLGANTLSALITRGLVEMKKFGIALGGQADTFYGLAGLGDLILSCTDSQSRNRRFGTAISQGKSAQAALAEIGQAVEGYYNIETVYQLAQQRHICMPITEQIYQVIYQKIPLQTAIQTLFSRTLKGETA